MIVLIGIITMILIILSNFFKQLFLFYYRTDDMVDVISTRLQEAYGAWRLPGYATSGNPNNNILDERFSATALRRFGDENRRRKTFNKEIERQVSYTVNVCLNDAFNLLYCSFFYSGTRSIAVRDQGNG